MKIMGFDVSVIYTDDLPSGEYGHCKPVEAEIRISTQIPPQQQDAVRYHEAMHFIWSKTRAGDAQLNEEEVCTLVENFATMEEDE